MRTLPSIAAALAIAVSVSMATGSASADDTPQTKPTIDTLTVKAGAYVEADRTVTIEWSGDDDGDGFTRTGFCAQHKSSESEFGVTMGWWSNAWSEECFQTRDRRAEFNIPGLSTNVRAKVRVNYENGLQSPWSETETATLAN